MYGFSGIEIIDVLGFNASGDYKHPLHIVFCCVFLAGLVQLGISASQHKQERSVKTQVTDTLILQ